MKGHYLFKNFRRGQLMCESHLSRGTKDTRLGTSDLWADICRVLSIIVRSHLDTFNKCCVNDEQPYTHSLSSNQCFGLFQCHWWFFQQWSWTQWPSNTYLCRSWSISGIQQMCIMPFRRTWIDWLFQVHWLQSLCSASEDLSVISCQDFS